MKVFDLHESKDTWISCGMKNPVSSERSKDVINAFITGEIPHLPIPGMNVLRASTHQSDCGLTSFSYIHWFFPSLLEGLENYIYFSNLTKLVVVLILPGIFVMWHIYKVRRKNGENQQKPNFCCWTESWSLQCCGPDLWDCCSNHFHWRQKRSSRSCWDLHPLIPEMFFRW